MSNKHTIVQLKEIAKRNGCKNYSKLNKQELVKLVKKCLITNVVNTIQENRPQSNRPPSQSVNKPPNKMTLLELKKIARRNGCKNYSKLNKEELIKLIKKCLITNVVNTMQENRPQSNRPQSNRPHSDECPELQNKKYRNRQGPPRPANEVGCRGKRFVGNDGNLYVSKANVNGVYRWVRVK